MLVIPSPKCHCQEVGELVDVSVNWTAFPATGVEGEYLNEAAETVEDFVLGGITVIVRLFTFDPAPFAAVRLTL